MNMATPIPMPRQGQSVETCAILEWQKKKGDSVKEGDILFTYETDKASFECESPASGTLLETFFDEGDDVPVLTNVGVIGSEGESVDEFRPDSGGGQSAESLEKSEKPEEAAQPGPGPQPVSQQAKSQEPTNGKVKASPRARKQAEAQGVAIGSLAGSGPDGRVIARDVEAAAKNAPAMTKTAQAKAVDEGLSAPSGGTGIGGRIRAEDLIAQEVSEAASPEESVRDEVSEVKLTKIRSLIAQRMYSSLQQTAQLTMNASANASGLMAFRKKVKENMEAMGLVNITINDLVAFALSRVLPRFPEINALFNNDTLQQYRHVHLALAVDTPRGLMVPVVRFADTLPLNDLAARMKTLARQCIEGSINPDYLAGGTITISNLGMYGIESFTPVLNAPQVALLGVNTIVKKPVAALDGTVKLEPYIGLSLTIDHRAVDGAPGAKFLKSMVDAIENFEMTLAR
jgi:pyruvate dehydrogenase E2 component (dihydrolipoamide acetyltransferase)